MFGLGSWEERGDDGEWGREDERSGDGGRGDLVEDGAFALLVIASQGLVTHQGKKEWKRTHADKGVDVKDERVTPKVGPDGFARCPESDARVQVAVKI